MNTEKIQYNFIASFNIKYIKHIAHKTINATRTSTIITFKLMFILLWSDPFLHFFRIFIHESIFSKYWIVATEAEGEMGTNRKQRKKAFNVLVLASCYYELTCKHCLLQYEKILGRIYFKYIDVSYTTHFQIKYKSHIRSYLGILYL